MKRFSAVLLFCCLLLCAGKPCFADDFNKETLIFTSQQYNFQIYLPLNPFAKYDSVHEIMLYIVPDEEITTYGVICAKVGGQITDFKLVLGNLFYLTLESSKSIYIKTLIEIDGFQGANFSYSENGHSTVGRAWQVNDMLYVFFEEHDNYGGNYENISPSGFDRKKKFVETFRLIETPKNIYSPLHSCTAQFKGLVEVQDIPVTFYRQSKYGKCSYVSLMERFNGSKLVHGVNMYFEIEEIRYDSLNVGTSEKELLEFYNYHVQLLDEDGKKILNKKTCYYKQYPGLEVTETITNKLGMTVSCVSRLFLIKGILYFLQVPAFDNKTNAQMYELLDSFEVTGK